METLSQLGVPSIENGINHTEKVSLKASYHGIFD